ncbi:MAG: prepilin-type N-terminal cleavage/methylation domain-containing protein [Variovorax sp.]
MPVPRRCARRPARGFGLVELMVGLALGLIVVVLVSSVFLGTHQATRTTDSLGRAQETVRTAFEVMARELREAGGNPCDSNVPVANVLNSAQGTAAWSVDWEQPFQGFDDNQVFAGAAFGTGVGQRVIGTDAVMAKYIADLDGLTVVAHDNAAARFTVNNTPPRVRAGGLLMVCTYGQGAVFSASAVGAGSIDHVASGATDGNCSTGLGVPTLCVGSGSSYVFGPGAKIGQVISTGWYIGNNGRPETGGRSLFRVARDGPEEIAEGISDMQLEYVVPGAAAYASAGAITDWAGVAGLRVTLTLRGAQAGVATNTSGRLERPTTFTLYLRNRQP